MQGIERNRYYIGPPIKITENFYSYFMREFKAKSCPFFVSFALRDSGKLWKNYTGTSLSLILF